MADRKKTLDRLLRVRSLQLNLVRADEARAQAKRDSERTLKDRIAALAENPHLLEPVRDCQNRIVERIRSTAADPALSLIAFLAVEGLKALDLFETDPLTPVERESVLNALLLRLSTVRAG